MLPYMGMGVLLQGRALPSLRNLDSLVAWGFTSKKADQPTMALLIESLCVMGMRRLQFMSQSLLPS